MYLYKGEDMQIEGGWKNSEKSVRKKNYLSERERESVRNTMGKEILLL